MAPGGLPRSSEPWWRTPWPRGPVGELPIHQEYAAFLPLAIHNIRSYLQARVMRFFGWLRGSKEKQKHTTPSERVREITTWLKHPISVSEALDKLTEYYRAPPFRATGSGSIRAFLLWLAEEMQLDDDLWWYDT